MREIIMRVVMDDDAQAQDMLDQITARMTNTTVGDPAGPAERTSYVRMQDPADGSLVAMEHVDEFGIVRNGEYTAPDPHPIWVQPTGAQDSYPANRLDGDPTRVVRNGRIYLNVHGNGNSWEPGTDPSLWEDEGAA